MCSSDLKDFALANGNHFAVFVDRAPLGARKDLRWRICSEQEKQPIQPGEDRRPCKDDRKTVFLTDKEEVLTGQAGQLVGNRFRIVRIGLESVDIQEVGSEQTRRIPLGGK